MATTPELVGSSTIQEVHSSFIDKGIRPPPMPMYWYDHDLVEISDQSPKYPCIFVRVNTWSGFYAQLHLTERDVVCFKGGRVRTAWYRLADVKPDFGWMARERMKRDHLPPEEQRLYDPVAFREVVNQAIVRYNSLKPPFFGEITGSFNRVTERDYSDLLPFPPFRTLWQGARHAILAHTRVTALSLPWNLPDNVFRQIALFM